MLDYMILVKLRNHHADSYYHSLRVSLLCFQVANNVGMDLNQCLTAVRAGMLHDVGKLRIPAHILSKSGPLSHSEYEFIQKHVEFGIRMLKKLGYRQDILDAVEGHHEREDGRGYPKRVIPKDRLTKIIAVCDVFDAMTEQRSYKESMPKEYVLEQMEMGKLGAFQHEFVEALRYIVLVETKVNAI